MGLCPLSLRSGLKSDGEFLALIVNGLSYKYKVQKIRHHFWEVSLCGGKTLEIAIVVFNTYLLVRQVPTVERTSRDTGMKLRACRSAYIRSSQLFFESGSLPIVAQVRTQK